jgi:hypothetical protein
MKPIHLVLVLLPLLAGAAAYAFLAARAEREELVQLNEELDAQLQQKRAIAGDVDKYRLRIAAMKVPYEHLTHMLSPRFEEMKEKLAASEVELKVGPPAERQSLELIGRTGKGLETALSLLQASKHLVHLTELTLDEAGWKAQGYALSAPELPPSELRPTLKLEHNRSWFSSLNEDEWKTFDALAAETNALGDLMNEIDQLTRTKKDMEAKVSLIEAFREELGAENLLRDIVLPAKIRRATIRIEGDVATLDFTGGEIRSAQDLSRFGAKYVFQDISNVAGQIRASAKKRPANEAP